MKILIMFMVMIASPAWAENLVWEVPVKSQVQENYSIQVTITGVLDDQKVKVTALVEEAVKEIAGQYSKLGFIREGRVLLFSRLEKRMKRKQLNQDGMGSIIITKKDGQVIEVD